ncbi:Peflin [Tetrabaena socialis]|uniref:Peflin n=1 Tax=Tetrabaena socialis TaxID=47790 RepID=A0A2J7ZV05_9CHLO|nr:Peflin [Tetrabaena socialis]|eukprot:PNH04080.1 Peflin [Tetrabaena socialis]
MAVDPLVARLWFESVDIDKSGSLCAKELRQALDIGGLSFSLGQAHLFVRAFDSQGNHRLNVNEFVALHSFLAGAQECFAQAARGARALAAADAAQALGRLGFTADAPAMQALLSRHDPEAKGLLTAENFLSMSLFMLSARRAFTTFDTARSGRIELSFNQFVYTSSHLA